jgi:hypothetical protein
MLVQTSFTLPLCSPFVPPLFLFVPPLTLSTYGLGTLFERWELRLMFLSEVFTSTIGPTPQQHADCTVVFNLPPLQEFGGLNKKVTRVDPRALTHDVSLILPCPSHLLHSSQPLPSDCTKHKDLSIQTTRSDDAGQQRGRLPLFFLSPLPTSHPNLHY